MKKILTIARREYKAMVGTKAFLLSIVMMPVLMLGGLFALRALQNVGTVKETARSLFTTLREFCRYFGRGFQTAQRKH